MYSFTCHNPTGTIDGKMPEVRGKVNGVVELTCSVGPPYSADVSSGTLHVVEWVRQGLDIPVMIKFGSYPPRVHPQYEGEQTMLTAGELCGLTQLISEALRAGFICDSLGEF